MPHTKPFEGLTFKDTPIAGGKGASLGEMTQAGIPVPPGFVVLASAFEHFLEETDLGVEIDAILDDVDHRQIHTVENASEKIQSLISGADMPGDIQQEILSSFDTLGADLVAVRSSATSEDSHDAAWAGQLDSHMNIERENVVHIVQECWASLFTPRAIFYRFEKSLHDTKISVAVVIQKMVKSEISGIAFSVHPVTEDESQMIIEAGWGFGDAVVSGSITPDSYVVEKNPRNTLDVNVSTQERQLVRRGKDEAPDEEWGENVWKDVPAEKRNKQKLSKEQIIQLSDLILKIEGHYGFPCDIEWAFEDGKFYITQSRPITTLGSHTRIVENENKSIVDEILQTPWHHLGKWIEPALAAEVWLEYASTAQQFFQGKLDGKILYLNGDFFLSQHDSDIFHNEAYEAAKTHNKSFFETIYSTVRRVTSQLVESVDSTDSVISFLEQYKQLTGVWMPLNNIAAGIERYVQETNPSAFAMAKGYLNEKPLTLQQIDEMKELSVDDAAQVEKHVEKYRWLGTHHFNISELTVEGLLKRMEQSKAKDQIKKEYESYDEETEYLIWLLDIIGYVRFKAAETSGYTTYHFKKHLDVMAAKHGVTYEDIVEHTMAEITAGTINKEIAEERKKNAGFYFNGVEHVLPEEDVKKCLDPLIKQESTDSDQVKGLCAQTGRVTGKVKIVTRQDQMEGFKDGMVLVAYETTPDIVFAMQKCSAIVTDFGGLTSHAAIIARELKKPCVVGTKNATKVLKDGDMVEVDADNGTVKLIKNISATTENFGLNKITKILDQEWVKVWTTEYSLFSIWLFGREYIDNCREEVGYGFEDIIFLVEGDLATVYRIDSAQKEFARAGAEKTFREPGFQARILSQVTELDSRFTSFFKLSPSEFLQPKNLEDFIAIHKKYLPYFLTVLWSPNALNDLEITEDKKKEIFEAYETARKQTERTYPEAEKFYQKVFSYIAKKEKIEEKFLRALLPEELLEYARSRKLPDTHLLRERYDYAAVIANKDMNTLLVGEDAEALIEKISHRNVQDVKEVFGTSATKGKVRGKVRKIFRENDVGSFTDDDILVTTMTRPEWLPAMQKAKAFVTDAGGVLCHAAIVAREMQKPCVIGTKIATQVFKDGDMVEVDADNGVVRIMKQE